MASGKRKRRRTIRHVFLTGLVVILPVVVSFWVIKLILSMLHRAVTPYVLQIIRLAGFGALLEKNWVGWTAPVVSVSLLILLILLLGLFGGNVIGRQLLAAFDRLLMNVPFVRPIYSATKQFMNTFSSGSRAFRKVVLVEYPRNGLWTLALLTNETGGEVRAKVGVPMVSVFVPTTPNPTSGWLLFVPEDEVVEMDMSVDDAFKLIISGGVLEPGMADGPQKLPVEESDALEAYDYDEEP